jgi:hypothetical protein
VARAKSRRATRIKAPFLSVRRQRFSWGCELIEQASQSRIGCFLVRMGGKSPFLPPARPDAHRRHVERLTPEREARVGFLPMRIYTRLGFVAFRGEEGALDLSSRTE